MADDNSDVFRLTSDILWCSFSPPSAKMANNHTRRTTALGTSDGVASGEPNLFELSRVTTELDESQMSPCGRQSLPLLNKVSARGSASSATGWIIQSAKGVAIAVLEN